MGKEKGRIHRKGGRTAPLREWDHYSYQKETHTLLKRGAISREKEGKERTFYSSHFPMKKRLLEQSNFFEKGKSSTGRKGRTPPITLLRETTRPSLTLR